MNVQGKQSETEYLRSFKSTEEALDEAGGVASGRTAAVAIVAKEKGVKICELTCI